MSKYMTDQRDSTDSEPLSSHARDYIESKIGQLGELNQEDCRDFNNQNVAARALGDLMSYGFESESIHALDSLLSIIDKAPDNFKNDTPENAYLRLGALKSVRRSYAQKFHKDPELNKIIIDTLLKRRSKYDKSIGYTIRHEDSLSIHSKEVWKIKEFLELIVGNEKDPENLLNIFKCLLEGTGMEDFSIAVREKSLMVEMLDDAKRDPELFLKYVDILLEKDEKFDYTDEFDYKAQYNLYPLYNYIFKTFPNLDFEVRKQIEERVFNRIIETVQNHPDDGIRDQYISPLYTIIRLPAEEDEELLEQQVRMESEILKTLTKVAREEPSKERNFRYTAAYSAYTTLAEMMKLYSRGVIYNSPPQLLMQEGFSEEYEEAFQALTENIPKEMPYRQEILGRIKEFLNLEILEEKKHPFFKSGRKFLINHYAEKTKEA